MSEIPLHLQRKQRRATKSVLPVAAATPKRTDLKNIVDSLQRPTVTYEVHDGRMIPKPAK
jgi:hypothetical protein